MSIPLLTMGILAAAGNANSSNLNNRKFKLFEVKRDGKLYNVINTALGVTVFTGTHKQVNDWLKANKLL
jgi:hypothetical protein